MSKYTFELSAVGHVEIIPPSDEVSDRKAIEWFVQAHGLEYQWPERAEPESDDANSPQFCVRTPSGTYCRTTRGWLKEMLGQTHLGRKHLEVIKDYLRFLDQKGSQEEP